MAFQVLINFDDMKNKPLNIAHSSEEFKTTTVKELKEKFRFKVPGAPGRKNINYLLFKITQVCVCVCGVSSSSSVDILKEHD